MNRHKLKALRNLFHLSVKEAAEHVGHVSARTWNYWENGTYNIPADVIDEMWRLCELRNKWIYLWYLAPNHAHDFTDYVNEKGEIKYTEWRVSQSVYAHRLWLE